MVAIFVSIFCYENPVPKEGRLKFGIRKFLPPVEETLKYGSGIRIRMCRI
jgi:hypothetical protein